jgi:entericidin A
MKRVMAVAMLALFSIATLSACNTMEGLGKDVKKLGQKVEEKAGSLSAMIDVHKGRLSGLCAFWDTDRKS